MKMNKQYRKGGFFMNSEERFKDHDGAGQGINMAYKSQGRFPGLGGKGAAIRREKRYLKKLNRQGKLNDEGPRSADRLDYLRKLQKDRYKKYVGANALAAGAILAAPALIGAAGAAGAAGAGAGAAGAAGAGAAGAAGATGAAATGAAATGAATGAAGAGAAAGGGGIGAALGKLGITKATAIDAGKKALERGIKKADINQGLDRNLQLGLNDPDMAYDEERIDDNAFNRMQMVDPSGGNTLMDRVALGDYGFELPSGQRMTQTTTDRRRPDMNMEDLFRLLQSYQRGEKGMKILKGGQKKLDKNNDGKITGEDFKLLQAMKAMYGAKLPR